MSTIIRTRHTFDGIRINVWSDGDIADGAGRVFSNVRLSVPDALLVAEEATLATASELPKLMRTASKLARQGELTPGNLRARAFPKIARPGVLYSQSHAGRARRDHIRNCRKLRCRICG